MVDRLFGIREPRGQCCSAASICKGEIANTAKPFHQMVWTDNRDATELRELAVIRRPESFVRGRAPKFAPSRNVRFAPKADVECGPSF